MGSRAAGGKTEKEEEMLVESESEMQVDPIRRWIGSEEEAARTAVVEEVGSLVGKVLEVYVLLLVL